MFILKELYYRYMLNRAIKKADSLIDIIGYNSEVGTDFPGVEELYYYYCGKIEEYADYLGYID